jgi:hypothetical protein
MKTLRHMTIAASALACAALLSLSAASAQTRASQQAPHMSAASQPFGPGMGGPVYAADPSMGYGPVQAGGSCWVSTDNDRAFGYFGPCAR